MPNRRQFLSSLALPFCAAAAPPRPNFVFILLDDARWDDIRCGGNTIVDTPHIDRLAREGAMFQNAFVTTPLCSPSRASFLTGQYAHTHKVEDNTDHSALSHRLNTWPRQLQGAGYETAFIGKWHMGVDATPRPGFDYWVGFEGQGTYFNPDLNINGKVVKHQGYTTDILSQHAVEFLDRDRTRPFVLYLPHKAVHPELTQYADGSLSDPNAGVFVPAERHKKLYLNAPVPHRPNFDRVPDDKPALLRPIPGMAPLGPATGTDDETVRNRLRMMVSVDEGIGRMLAVLEKRNELDNTVFVFTSDEGYFYGEHGLSVERRLAYEESIRIPLIVRYPRLIKAGSKPEQMALNIDIAPTMLQLAGVPIPSTVEGRSLEPIFAGRATRWRQSFLIEHAADNVFPRTRGMAYQCVRTTSWKYIHYTELGGMDELYNLQADPYEMKNLIHESHAQKILAGLQKQLQRFLS